MTPKPVEANGVREIYELLRYAAAHRQPVAATYDGQPRLLCPHVGGESQAACRSSAISSEEVVIVSSLWPQRIGVFGVAWLWRNSVKSSCALARGTPSHAPPIRLASMQSISTPTLSRKKIHSRGSAAVAAAIGVPG